MIRVLKCLQVLLASAALTLSAAPSANAGLIFVSGDFDIIQPDPGNLRLFQNILSGGSGVVIQGASSAGSIEAGILNSLYNSFGGVNSTILNGRVTATSIAGAKLFVSIYPDAPYTADELTAMSNFLAADGSIFFLGENGPFGSVQNANINSALMGLDSGLRIIDAVIDGGFHVATGEQIVNDPFTAGISAFLYASSSEVSGGSPLFLGTGGEPFIAYQRIPEPGTILLLGIGMAGFYAARKRCDRQIMFLGHDADRF